MKKLMISMVVLAMTLTSCGNSKNAVSYAYAENYFVNNTYQNTEVETLKIDNQEEFDKVFGGATTMTSRPTAIDFSKKTVLAIVAPASEKEVKITIRAMERTYNGGIFLKYAVSEGKDLGYSAQSAQILIVDKTDKEVEFRQVP
jgi:hypothetical protein